MQWGNRWRAGVVLLGIAAALVSALAFVEPARADDGGTSADAAATTESEAPPADQTTGTADEPTTDPEPAPTPEPPPADPPPPEPEPEPEPEPPVTTEPPAEEPVVTIEPEPEPTPEPAPEPSSCPESEAEACDAAGEDTATAESPPAEPTEPPAQSAPPASSSPPPSAPPAAGASSTLVVSLAPAPNETATAPVAPAAEPVADLEAEPAQPSAVKHWAPLSESPAVALASAPVRVARLVEGPFVVAPAAAWPAAATAQPLSPATLTYIQRITGPNATGSNQGARAGPTERDGGHREVETAEAEPQPPSVAGGPQGLLDDQGLGASGGSAGGAAGNAASSRYFAIATTPMRFAFPSAFAYAPPPSSVPEGALEAAPTTRPG